MENPYSKYLSVTIWVWLYSEGEMDTIYANIADACFPWAFNLQSCDGHRPKWHLHYLRLHQRVPCGGKKKPKLTHCIDCQMDLDMGWNPKLYESYVFFFFFLEQITIDEATLKYQATITVVDPQCLSKF